MQLHRLWRLRQLHGNGRCEPPRGTFGSEASLLQGRRDDADVVDAQLRAPAALGRVLRHQGCDGTRGALPHGRSRDPVTSTRLPVCVRQRPAALVREPQPGERHERHAAQATADLVLQSGSHRHLRCLAGGFRVQRNGHDLRAVASCTCAASGAYGENRRRQVHSPHRLVHVRLGTRHVLGLARGPEPRRPRGGGCRGGSSYNIFPGLVHLLGLARRARLPGALCCGVPRGRGPAVCAEELPDGAERREADGAARGVEHGRRSADRVAVGAAGAARRPAAPMAPLRHAQRLQPDLRPPRGRPLLPPPFSALGGLGFLRRLAPRPRLHQQHAQPVVAGGRVADRPGLLGARGRVWPVRRSGRHVRRRAGRLRCSPGAAGDANTRGQRRRLRGAQVEATRPSWSRLVCSARACRAHPAQEERRLHQVHLRWRILHRHPRALAPRQRRPGALCAEQRALADDRALQRQRSLVVGLRPGEPPRRLPGLRARAAAAADRHRHAQADAPGPGSAGHPLRGRGRRSVGLLRGAAGVLIQGARA
mmetsp:Transcript_144479/g.461939  ORF Transcript_144479/g.461939 Transcript_144479/m.461939 type:complete len:536 (+) Transcript_144479:527-2134(+)